jgi:RNA polymerase sigma-70 factor (ECF subfamily)
MNEDRDMQPERWLEDHGDYLFRYALTRLGDKATAEDAVQEAFLGAMKSKDRYDGKTPIRYWLLGILKHKVVDAIRKRAKETMIEDFEDPAITGTLLFKITGMPSTHPPEWRMNPRKAFEQQEFWEIFHACLSNLKGNLRQAFALRELEGMSTSQICKELDITPNNLWVILHRSRGQLKECLETNWLKKHREGETD